MEQIIQHLSSSPLFNLSLASKELFHSNFISWLCNKYKAEMGELFSSFIGNKSGNLKIRDCKRESKNIDLTITFENFEVLYIENKVKSVPYEEQLNTYETKTVGSNYLLLTLINPEIQSNSWKVLKYSDFAKLLEIFNNNNFDSYEKLLISDYISFIKSLSDLSNYLQINFESDKFDFNSNLYVELKKIRLHDLYSKFKYDQLAHRIYELNRNVFPKSFFDVDHTNILDKDCLIVNSGMMNGKGLVFIYIPFYSSMGTTIFLDGSRLGLGFYGDDITKVEKLKNKLHERFVNYIPIKYEYILGPKRKKSNDIWNKFNKGKYLYKATILNNKITITELIDYINKYIRLAKKLKTQLD